MPYNLAFPMFTGVCVSILLLLFESGGGRTSVRETEQVEQHDKRYNAPIYPPHQRLLDAVDLRLTLQRNGIHLCLDCYRQATARIVLAGLHGHFLVVYHGDHISDSPNWV